MVSGREFDAKADEVPACSGGGAGPQLAFRHAETGSRAVERYQPCSLSLGTGHSNGPAPQRVGALAKMDTAARCSHPC